MFVTIPNINDSKTVGYLGNTFFMLANAAAYAKRTDQSLFLKPFEFQNLFKHKFFTIKKEDVKVEHEFQEPGFNFSEIPRFESVSLSGYFQSYKYFEDIDTHKLLLPSTPLSSKIFESRNKDLEKKNKDIIFNNSVCAIHVRRGDFLNFSSFHHNLPMNYYWEAMGIMEEQTKIDYYMIFSNDIPWAMENFRGGKFIFSDTRQEKPQGNSSAAFDLYLMSYCSHQIIANSTFSWWGAFLNANKHKNVISPNGEKYPWFGPALRAHDTKDLIPNGWICL